MEPPARPVKCPKCGEQSPCTDWNEIDIGVGIQTWNLEFTCPAHGTFAYLGDGEWVFQDDPESTVKSES